MERILEFELKRFYESTKKANRLDKDDYNSLESFFSEWIGGQTSIGL